jgi:hypothetical protein
MLCYLSWSVVSSADDDDNSNDYDYEVCEEFYDGDDEDGDDGNDADYNDDYIFSVMIMVPSNLRE